MAGSTDTIVMPALGRPFQLGMLYDCRKDTLIPGITLWDLETLQNHVDTKPQSKTEFQIIASDTTDDKASALNVTASLKASFLSGLVEVNGAAEYLSDTKTSKHQARVSLQYSTTTQFKQLTMSHLGLHNISYPDVFDQGTATHVVTAVLYGAQAFFVFDQNISSSENIQDIHGKLQVIIKKIPQVSIEGEGALKMDDMEKAQAEKLSCKFYGDFALENNPVTYQDAMKTYSILPKLLGENEKKAVPVRVWLYPLTKLDSRAAQLVREISTELIFDVQTALDQLTELNVRCNDALKNQIATKFPEIQRTIQQFNDLCKQHRQTFQTQLAGLLPSIRGGGKEESILVDILTGNDNSPFNTLKLSEFLGTKEEEMDYVTQLSVLSKAEVVPSQRERDKILLDPGLHFVVSFTFTSLREEEPYLSDLKQWLQAQSIKETHDPASASSVAEKPISKAWFEENEIKKKARRYAESLSHFVSVNKSNGKTRFIVASVPDKDNPGTAIYLYEDGELVSTNFEPPSKPLPALIDGIRHDRVQLTFNPAANGRAAISGYQAEYRIVGQENWAAVDVNNTQETFTVTGLRANTEYQFRYAAVSKPGLSESSDVSDPVKTLPSTCPPGKPVATAVESSAITLSWESPSVIGDGVSIREYKVEYKEEAGAICHEGKEKWLERRTGERTESCTIDGLTPETPYRFRVSAVCVDGAVSDPSEEIWLSTLKAQPDRRILLVGKTGAGKSETGNTILGAYKFISGISPSSITQDCERQEAVVNGRKITVVDTPGLFDTKRCNEETCQKIRESVKLLSTGIHAIIHVIQLGRFTQEEKDVVKEIQKIFNFKAKNYMIILFTRKEDLGSKTLDEFLAEGDKDLQTLIQTCGNRCLAFNNRAEGTEKSAQVSQLLKMIDEMVYGNCEQPCYTEEMLKTDKSFLQKFCFIL